MKLSGIARLGLLKLGFARCSLSKKQGQHPNPCQSGEGTNCLGMPGHVGGGRGSMGVRPDHVWCADITYIPVRRGFLYLVVIMDWATRHVLAWRLSNTMDTGFCIEALREAMARHGRPEIFNTDQGSQFTSLDFTGVLEDAGVAISMDGRGRCMDNIFIERLWRSLKYEAVYLHEITDGFAAGRVIGEWIAFYSTERPHSALDGATPAEAYSASRPVDMMDKAPALPTYPQAKPQQKASKMIEALAA
jgi:transposase InsO family protein